MIRYLKTVQGKPVSIMVAGSKITKGAPLTQDFTDDTVDPAATGLGLYLADIEATYEGINAIVNPTDDSFETAAAGARVLVIPTIPGESYATTELTATGLAKGDALVATSGKFVKAGTSTKYAWVYGDTYSDPTGLTMYKITRVDVDTTAAS